MARTAKRQSEVQRRYVLSNNVLNAKNKKSTNDEYNYFSAENHHKG